MKSFEEKYNLTKLGLIVSIVFIIVLVLIILNTPQIPVTNVGGVCK